MKRLRQTMLACGFVGLFVTFCQGAEVIKNEVKGQNFVADFYCRPDSTNTVGVLLLSGSRGGKPHAYFPQFLATNGYRTLALAYFKEKGLPQNLQLIPLEYFDKAIEWMETNKQIHVDHVVVIGASRGAELALLLGSTNPKIRGVIALSPSSVVWNGTPKELPIIPCSSWTLAGKPIPFMPYDSTKFVAPRNMHDIYLSFQKALKQIPEVEKASIEVEKIHGPVLLVSGKDDPVWPATEMANAICFRLKKKGFKYQFENLQYPDAGHTLDERSMYGGTFEGNKNARIGFGEHTLTFLRAIEDSR